MGMPQASAAARAREVSRLAKATTFACFDLANAGKSRSLILATPKIPQRTVLD
jgi:hypothetical protein